jgi:hypothetical protein
MVVAGLVAEGSLLADLAATERQLRPFDGVHHVEQGDVARVSGEAEPASTYIIEHDSEKVEILLAAIRRIWGDRPPAQTLIGVASLALPDMLFEVDAVAAST